MRRNYLIAAGATFLMLPIFLAGCAKKAMPPAAERTIFLLMDCSGDIRVDLVLRPDTGTAAQDSSSIRARFVDDYSLRSMAGAQLRLLSGDQVIAEGTSSTNADVTLRVRPGRYRLEGRQIGYQLTWTDLVLDPGKASVVEVPMWMTPICE